MVRRLLTTRPGSKSAARVVILGGAGIMGRITTRDLLRNGRGAVQVVVADRDLRAVRDGAAERVEVDVQDRGSVEQALRGAFAVIASLPYRYNLDAMRGALAAGAHYIDLGGLFHMTRRQLEMAPEFERAGLMALLGMGSAPGIINLLAVLAADTLDAVHEVHCLVGAVDRTRFRSAPPLGFGYAVDTLLDEFTLPSAVFRRGAFEFVPPLDPRERLRIRFPPPVGSMFVDTTLHSEVATLPLHFASRGVREVTFRQGFDADFMDKLSFLVKLGLAEATQADGTAVSPRQMLLSLLRRFPPAIPVGRPARHEVLRALVRGRRGRRRVSVVADCYAGPRSGAGIGPDIDTGAPPSIAVQLMLSGAMPIRPGVWAPEQVVPVQPFVRELERRGMRVRRRG
ncbi:MAG TPA: saccharopine dehydrogenase NADP-binding domain-containing protein [Gemmatimonadales bacterium]|nr:saccharopine dehydrogenase NADP-binding domain-containing protein [Gemmatimonadales bacterium]